MKTHFVKLTILLLCTQGTLLEDFYELLGINKDANNREIRKAFKKLALKYHPDKNSEEDAHEKFLKINRAYEVLKDDDSRKKYDIYGDDDGDSQRNRKQNYQSWNYYNDDFGIYDDDKEIVTLDSGDFRRSVLESSDIWFINFYSPRCSHCHDLAPIWRRLAVLLEGVVRVGAVNCQEEFMLCRGQGISGYPSLNLYTRQQGTLKFRGRKEEEEILQFLVSFLPDRMVDLWAGNLDKFSRSGLTGAKSWLVMFCDDTASCMTSSDKRLLGAALDGLTNLGSVDCGLDTDVCDKLRGDENQDAQLLFFPAGLEDKSGAPLSSSIHEFKEIAAEVLEYLPEVTKFTQESFKEMRNRLDNEIGASWLVIFVNGDIGDGIFYKKIPAFIPRQRLGKVDCADLAEVCRDLHITKFPSFAMFKLGGGWELHYGKDNIEDVIQFTRLASQARTMETLVASDFPEVITSGQPVIIDFFAPWCPPCMNFLPEFRKASTIIGGQVSFATVDCSVHSSLCNQHNIRSYPSTIFFNNTKPHKFQGNHDPQSVADFVLDVLRPSVVNIDGENFMETVGSKTEDEMWLVDFFAPWCRPCQELAPEWRKLAKQLQRIPDVKVGQVDCVANSDICHKYGVTGYPTIRMYPFGSQGHSRYFKYQQYHRDAESLLSWVQASLPSYVDTLTPYKFEHSVLGTDAPWIVMFYAPWCGHCTRFMPKLEDLARVVRGQVRVGKVNCEKFGKMCDKASVRAYPTLRYVRGRNGQERYVSQDIQERDGDKIVEIVRSLVREEKVRTSEKPESAEEVEPLLDENNQPEQDREDVPHADQEEEDTDEFVYYEDDELFHHDEL